MNVWAKRKKDARPLIAYFSRHKSHAPASQGEASQGGRRIFDLSLTFSDFSSINTMETVVDILTNAETATPEQPAKHALRFLKAVKDKDLRFMGRFVHDFGEDIARYAIWRHINKCPVLLTNQHLLASFPSSMINTVDQINQGLLAKTNSAFIITTDGSRVQYYQSLVRLFLLNPIHCLNRARVDVKSATKSVLTFDDKYKSLGLPHLLPGQSQPYHLKDPFVLRTRLQAGKYDSQMLVFLPKDAATLGSFLIKRRKEPKSTKTESGVVEDVENDNTLLSVDFLLAYMECLEQEGKCALTVVLKRLLLLIQDAKMASNELEKRVIVQEPSHSVSPNDSLQYWKISDKSDTVNPSEAWNPTSGPEKSAHPLYLDSEQHFNLAELGKGWLDVAEPGRSGHFVKSRKHNEASKDTQECSAHEARHDQLVVREGENMSVGDGRPLQISSIYRLRRYEIDAFHVAAKNGPAMRTPVAAPVFGIAANYAELDEYTLLSQLMHDPVLLRRFKVIAAFKSKLYRRYTYLTDFCRALATSKDELVAMVSNDDTRRIGQMMELYFDRFFGKLMLNGENGCLVAEAWLIDVLKVLTQSASEPILCRENENAAIDDFRNMVNECVIQLMAKGSKAVSEKQVQSVLKKASPIEELRLILENPTRDIGPLDRVSRLIRHALQKEKNSARQALAS